MEESNQTDEIDPNEDFFFDALDDFPFSDSSVTNQSNENTSDSTLRESSPELSSPATTLRLRSDSRLGFFLDESKDSNAESSCISSDIFPTHDSNTRGKGKRFKLYSDLKENEKNLEISESIPWNRDGVDAVGVTSRVSAEDDQKMESKANDELEDSSSGNIFVFLVELMIKAIGFQVNILVNFVTFPIRATYNSYMLLVDPFGAMRRGRGFLLQIMVSTWNLVIGIISPLVGDWLTDQEKIWKLLWRFGYASFWSFFVCFVLCGLLVFAMMMSGLLMRYLVENPIEIKEDLNFDYTKNSPVAFVPVVSCGAFGCEYCENKSLGARIIPPYHNLIVNLELTLPESRYNRNLGMFQVRVDFLSLDGKTLASKRQPCMLRFKSEPIHSMVTFFKVAPLITGYMSESQTIKVKFKGITEGHLPTSCIKVIIEQRAEYWPVAGVPELYDASFKLESELPFIRRIIWSWKKTIFVWISMILFIMELLFTLICCTPIIIPRTRQRVVPDVTISTPNLTQLS